MRLKQIKILEYPNQKSIGELMRISDFYENTELQNTVFTEKECVDWWIRHGISNPKMYWNGFNFPTYVMKRFTSSFYDQTPEEIDAITVSKGSKYVIAYIKGDEATLIHELSHAMFYLSWGYKDDMLDMLWNYDVLEITNGLEKKMGYAPGFIQDECIAYLIDGGKDLKDELGINLKEYRALMGRLRDIFRRYLEKLCK